MRLSGGILSTISSVIEIGARTKQMPFKFDRSVVGGLLGRISASLGMAKTSEAEYKKLRRMRLDLRPEQLKVFRAQTLKFEGPSKLNNMPMFLNTSFKLGAFSYFRGGLLKSLDSVGRYSSIGPNVIVGEAEHPTSWLSTSPAFYYGEQFVMTKKEREQGFERSAWAEEEEPFTKRKTVIGNDVWIGANVIIRKGVKLGDGCVVGAGAVVVKDVKPYEIVGGVPAKHIKWRLADSSLRDDLELLRWWDFDANDLTGIPFKEPAEAIRQIIKMERDGDIQRRPIAYKTVTLTTGGYVLGSKKAKQASLITGLMSVPLAIDALGEWVTQSAPLLHF